MFEIVHKPVTIQERFRDALIKEYALKMDMKEIKWQYIDTIRQRDDEIKYHMEKFMELQT